MMGLCPLVLDAAVAYAKAVVEYVLLLCILVALNLIVHLERSMWSGCIQLRLGHVCQFGVKFVIYPFGR